MKRLLLLCGIVAAGLSAATEGDGTTPLHRAAHQDDVAAARQLLAAGGAPDAANRYGITPLSLACTNGSGPMVELLLKAGANPNGLLPGGETPLMQAARTGGIEPVRALLAAGATVDSTEAARGQTALMWAAAEGHVAVVEMLIEAGATRDRRLASGFTPLLFAVREGRIGVVRALLERGVDVNQTIETVKSPGGAPNQGRIAPRSGVSALHLAVSNAHFELAGVLLDAGADPNAIGPGWTPLHAITWVRKPGGGDNDPAPRGSGTLSSLDLVRKLATHGANLNARQTRRINAGLTSLNTKGATPFLLAARTGDAELMRLLAKLGADPLIPNADGATPLIVAAGLGTRSPGEDAGAEAEVLEAVQAAIDLGNDPNAVDHNGETAMHGAAYKNLPAVVQTLADRGARPEVWNRPNKQGWTPLTIAEGRRFGNFKPSPETAAAIRRVLLAAGITPEATPRIRQTSNTDYGAKPAAVKPPPPQQPR